MIHRADVSRGQPSSDDWPLVLFCPTVQAQSALRCSAFDGKSHQQTSPNLDSFPHAGSVVDPLPYDIPHRKILLQLGVAVQQYGFIDDCFLQA